MPMTATDRPMGVKSNIEKLPAPLWALKLETIKLGGVPMSVVIPPKIVPKASGISTRPGGKSSRLASCKAIGMSKAIAPTLFMKPESSAPRPTSAAKLTVVPALAGIVCLTSTSTAPVNCNPRLSTSTQATVMTAGWPKPEKACSGAISPPTTLANNANMATMS